MGTKYKLPSIYSITNSMTKLSLKDYITERNRDGTKYKLPSIYSITNSMTKLSLKDYITERHRDGDKVYITFYL